MKQNKNLIFTVVVSLFALIAFSTNADAYIMANYSDSAFGDPRSMGAEREIKAGVIDSAGHFLESYANFLNLLSKIERTEPGRVDYNDLSGAVDSCISEMENARDFYLDLTKKAGITPYNKDVIKKLRKFDYAACQAKHELHPIVFEQTAGFLRSGDIRGLYKQLLFNVKDILSRLAHVKKEIKENRFPGIANLWKLNSLFSESLIFGQYTAMIFDKI